MWVLPYERANVPTAMCSLAAAVQGMDETVNNGAQAIYLAVSMEGSGTRFHI